MVIERLHQLASAGASGRLLVRGPAGTWWVHLHDGAVCGAERAGRPTMLVAMGEAGLFTADAWRAALHHADGPSWSALADGDHDRLRALAAFAEDFVRRMLADLQHHVRAGAAVTATFTAGVAHPFGPLATWPLASLLPPEPAAAAAEAEAEPVDASDLLALLEEISPHVRRTTGGSLRAC